MYVCYYWRWTLRKTVESEIQMDEKQNKILKHIKIYVCRTNFFSFSSKLWSQVVYQDVTTHITSSCTKSKNMHSKHQNNFFNCYFCVSSFFFNYWNGILWNETPTQIFWNKITNENFLLRIIRWSRIFTKSV